MKFNASDTTSGPTPNQKRNTKVGGGDGDGWRVLVALHSADYGRRTRGGYNANRSLNWLDQHGSDATDHRAEAAVAATNEGNRQREQQEDDDDEEELQQQGRRTRQQNRRKTRDPYNAYGYFAHADGGGDDQSSRGAEHELRAIRRTQRLAKE